MANLTTRNHRRSGDHRAQAFYADDLLSLGEAAALVRRSRQVVHRWVTTGALRTRRVLGTRRITLRDLVRFAQRRSIALPRVVRRAMTSADYGR